MAIANVNTNVSGQQKLKPSKLENFANLFGSLLSLGNAAQSLASAATPASTAAPQGTQPSTASLFSKFADLKKQQSAYTPQLKYTGGGGMGIGSISGTSRY